ncbi:Retrovirus-related Pol polyprotein from transposon 17.6, partial [Mucuna pruriens]
MDLAQQNYTTTEKELLAIVFALDKFRSYLLDSRIVVFFDHVALRYLLKKPDAKPRLIQWMLLLQEFNIEIKDKKGVENSIADHLSKIERESEPVPIRDEFPDEQLLHIKTSTPWFGNISISAGGISILQGKTLEQCQILLIKSFAGAFLTQRSIWSFSIAMHHLEAATMDQLGLPGKCWIVDSIGPPFSETHIT